MANNPPKQPSKTKDHLRSIAIAIGLIGFGVSVTYIIMSQTTPLREDLKDSRKQCSELLKKNEDYLNKIRGNQLINEAIVKENGNLKNELRAKNDELDKLKNQYSQAMDENKKLSSKIKQPQQKAYEPKESIKHNDNETQEVNLNHSVGFMNNTIFISLRSINSEDNINAVVHSTGYPEMPINNGIAGKTFIYRSDKTYEIRIMGIKYLPGHGTSFNYAIFLVKIK